MSARLIKGLERLCFFDENTENYSWRKQSLAAGFYVAVSRHALAPPLCIVAKRCGLCEYREGGRNSGECTN